MYRCTYCNSEVLHIEYQARSADEATRAVDICSSCKLDMDQVSRGLELMGDVSTLGYVKHSVPYPTKQQPRNFNEACTTVTGYNNEIEISCIDDRSRYAYNGVKSRPEAIISSYVERTITMPFVYEGISYSSIYRSRDYGGSVQRSVKVVLARDVIAPGVVYRNSDEWSTNHICNSPDMEEFNVTRYSLKVGEDYLVEASEVKSGSNTRYSFEVEIINPNPTEAHVTGALSILMEHCGCTYIGRNLVRDETKSYIISTRARAYDGLPPEVDDGSHIYVPKIDGTRCVMGLFGTLWIIMDDRCERYITYSVSPQVRTYSDYEWLMDVEYIPGEVPVLLDIFCAEKGRLEPSIRTYAGITELCKRFLHLVPIYVRTPYERYEEAWDAMTRSNLPCDGLMCMEKGNMTCTKIKEFPAIELIVRVENGARMLCTHDRYPMYPAPEGYDSIGSVYELRLARVGKVDGMVPRYGYTGEVSHEIRSYLLRPDKYRANTKDTVDNILRSQEHGYVSRRLVLKTITDMCFTTREAIYTRAKMASTGRRSIIIDVGSGRGQFYTTMQAMQIDRVLMIEPDLDSCTKFAKYHDVMIVDKNEMESTLQGLPRSDRFSVIFNCTLSEFLSINPQRLEYFMRSVACVTASFSYNYVYKDLVELRRRFGRPYIGCCYLYENLNNGVLYSSEDIVMEVVKGTDRAKVKWDDVEFVEPAITTQSISSLNVDLSIERMYPEHDLLKSLAVIATSTL